MADAANIEVRVTADAMTIIAAVNASLDKLGWGGPNGGASFSPETGKGSIIAWRRGHQGGRMGGQVLPTAEAGTWLVTAWIKSRKNAHLIRDSIMSDLHGVSGAGQSEELLATGNRDESIPPPYVPARRDNAAAAQAPARSCVVGPCQSPRAANSQYCLTHDPANQSRPRSSTLSTQGADAAGRQASKAETGRGGCLLALLIIGVLIYALAGACGGPSGGGAPSTPGYTQDQWLRCKDILYGSDYPVDRLTTSEQSMVTQCAAAAAR